MRKPVKAKTENTAFGYVIFSPQTGIVLVVVEWARVSCSKIGQVSSTRR